MIELFLGLLLSHFLGDFAFQPSHWIEDKRERQLKSPYLWFHIGVHALGLIIFILLAQMSLQYWLACLIVVVTHLIIDVIKAGLYGVIKEWILFTADQIAHLAVLFFVVNLYYSVEIPWTELFTAESLLFITAITLVTVVISVCMKIVMKKWSRELESLEELDTVDHSLSDAGKYIGMLERLLVFGFIIVGRWEAVGFLIAAKSIFRFGDLSRAKDRKLTEYVLIGTLLSFGSAILVAWIYMSILSKI